MKKSRGQRSIWIFSIVWRVLCVIIYWSRKLAPPSQPIRFKTQTIRDKGTRLFRAPQIAFSLLFEYRLFSCDVFFLFRLDAENRTEKIPPMLPWTVYATPRDDLGYFIFVPYNLTSFCRLFWLFGIDFLFSWTFFSLSWAIFFKVSSTFFWAKILR